jgi:hypothetical protein
MDGGVVVWLCLSCGSLVSGPNPCYGLASSSHRYPNGSGVDGVTPLSTSNRLGCCSSPQ